MNIKEKAKQFAIMAHSGQVRKSEPEKPMIVHPISVGLLLEDYGYDDKFVAAGFLHDVVEDTKYTIKDLEKEFGSKIASLVMGASEPNKLLSWEERKSNTIEKTKILPLDNKVVICADKINNLEDSLLKFQRTGKRDFSSFKRGEEKQKWYFTEIYNSLIINEDKNLLIFKKLKELIDLVFYNKNSYSKQTSLDAKKEEIIRMKRLLPFDRPFIIAFYEIQNDAINQLKEKLNKLGFKVDSVFLDKDSLFQLKNEETFLKNDIIFVNYFSSYNKDINVYKELIDMLITNSLIPNYYEKELSVITYDIEDINFSLLIKKIMFNMRNNYIKILNKIY